jgi:hypothetical protein
MNCNQYYKAFLDLVDYETNRRETIAKSCRHPRLFGFVYVDFIDQRDILETYFKGLYRFDYCKNILVIKIGIGNKADPLLDYYKKVNKFDYVFWGKHYATSASGRYLKKCDKKYEKRMIKNGLRNHKKRRS